MSELLNVSILGIIGTVTGILALLISWRLYSKQKPNIKIKVVKCEHNFPNLSEKNKTRDIRFWTKFQVKNVGDRGTKINAITLSFKTNGKEYHLKERNLQDELSDLLSVMVKSTPKNSDRWIKSHDTSDVGADFDSLFDGPEENQFECTFTICDTHKEYVVTSISKKVERPPLKGKPLGK